MRQLLVHDEILLGAVQFKNACLQSKWVTYRLLDLSVTDCTSGRSPFIHTPLIKDAGRQLRRLAS
jgi:hypothetical protein